MHAKRHWFLHWVLIIALAVLPMRAALAVNPGCGMHEHGNSSASPLMVNHDGHMAMKGHAHPTLAGADQPTTKHHCCCCDGIKGTCSPDCGMGLHASAIMTSVFSMTASYQLQIVTVAADALQTRELTPPSRPPLSLYV